MELFDLLNHQGEQTGQSKPRDQVHRDGDWHASVDVVVINSKSEILLQKRSATKEAFPNMWELSCSGHLSAGEDSVTAAVRELAEEVGIEAQTGELVHLFRVKEPQTLNLGTFIENEFKDVYLLKLDVDLEKLALQSSEVTAVSWTCIPELEARVSAKDQSYVPHPEIYPRLFAYLKTKL